MKTHSLLLPGPRQLLWITKELAQLQPDEVMIQTIAGAVSIGAELLFEYRTPASHLIETFEALAQENIAPLKVFVQYE